MSNKEILEKAIQKAIDSGFNPGPSYSTFDTETHQTQVMEPKEYLLYQLLKDITFRMAFIFNHDFAKALWGEVVTTENYTGQGPDLSPATYIIPKPAWQYHLQQMVIAEDPIKYLGENI